MPCLFASSAPSRCVRAALRSTTHSPLLTSRKLQSIPHTDQPHSLCTMSLTRTETLPLCSLHMRRGGSEVHHTLTLAHVHSTAHSTAPLTQHSTSHTDHPPHSVPCPKHEQRPYLCASSAAFRWAGAALRSTTPSALLTSSTLAVTGVPGCTPTAPC